MKLCESGITPLLLPALAEETNQRLWKLSESSHADLWARWHISVAASDSASLMYSIIPQSLQVLYSLCIFMFSLSPNVKPCISTCNMRWCGRVAAWTLSMSVIRKRSMELPSSSFRWWVRALRSSYTRWSRMWMIPFTMPWRLISHLNCAARNLTNRSSFRIRICFCLVKGKPGSLP